LAVKAFTPEFAEAFAEQVNGSAVYRQAAKGWHWTVGLLIEAEPDRGIPQPLGMFLDLQDGEARKIEMVEPARAQSCDFVISAPYTQWKRVMRRELDPIKGMIQGKLRVKGDLPTIVRYNKATQEMAECTTRFDIQFPDE